HRFDYSFTPQFTFFTPVPDSRFTVGGSVSAVRTTLNALTLYQPSEDALATLLGANITDGGAANVTAISGSVIAARSFGKEGRTSLGLEVEQLSSDGSFLNVRRLPEASASGGSGIESETQIARKRITFGLSHEFNGGKRLGLYYRLGMT